MRRRRMMGFTGADYIILKTLEARDQPYADLFGRMVHDAMLEPKPLEDGPLPSEIVATRPLRHYEATPAAIVATAWQTAVEDRNPQSAQEAAAFGLALVAKWPHYLIAVDMHPDLVHKGENS